MPNPGWSCPHLLPSMLEKVLPGHEDSLAIGPVKWHVVILPQAVLVVDDELEVQGCVLVAAFLHLYHDVLEIAIGVPRPIYDEAAAESHAMIPGHRSTCPWW